MEQNIKIKMRHFSLIFKYCAFPTGGEIPKKL